MIFITDESELNLNCKNTILYFYASWMPFHKKMLSMISKMEDKYKNFVFYGIDTDYFKNLNKIFDIQEIPTIIIRNENKELKRIIGVIMTSAFKSSLNDICNSAHLK